MAQGITEQHGFHISSLNLQHLLLSELETSRTEVRWRHTCCTSHLAVTQLALRPQCIRLRRYEMFVRPEQRHLLVAVHEVPSFWLPFEVHEPDVAHMGWLLG